MPLPGATGRTALLPWGGRTVVGGEGEYDGGRGKRGASAEQGRDTGIRARRVL